MAQYENLRSLAPAQENGNGKTEQKATAPKGKRGRKKQSDDTAIAKSPGHDLVNKQGSESVELVLGLERQEQLMTAARGYQKGQNLGKIELAAKTAGIVDVLVESLLERIDSLQVDLKDGLEHHSPLDILDTLGLRRNDDETRDLRAKIESLDGEDFSRFLL